MDKWGYNALIESKTLWEKEKLLVTSNFCFSHNVFKSCLLLMRKNEYLWSKRLTLYKRQNSRLGSNGTNFADNKEIFIKLWNSHLGKKENIVGKGQNAGYQHCFLF